MAGGDRAQVRLLGAFEARASDGSPVERLRHKEQALLAYMLLEPGERRSRSSLTQLLWPGLDRAAGRNNLRVALSRIRRGFGDAGWFHGDGDAIWVVAADVEVDVHAVVGGDVAAIEDFELLADLQLPGCDEFMEWLDVWRERVRLVVARTLEHHARRALDRGDGRGAEQLAARLIRLDPLVEIGHELRAVALIADGRPHAAADQLRECEVLLSVELGVEPGPVVRRMLRDLDRRPDTPYEDEAAQHALAPVALPVTSFVGRGHVLAYLDRVLRERSSRVVTITGAPGSGKSRLALEATLAAARYFQDGAVTVSLDGVEQPADVVLSIAGAFGMHAVAVSPSPPEALLSSLAEHDVLLVLDGADPVLDELAPLVAQIAQRCRYVVTIVTTREALALPAEDVMRIRGLDYPMTAGHDTAEQEAVRLFLDRAQRIDKGIRLEPATESAIVDICRAVEGQPFGLEFAAAALRTLPLEEVANRLLHRPQDLVVQRRDGDGGSENESLVSVFGSWVARLDADAGTALRGLSVFRGGFTPAAAEAVCGTTPSLLASLQRASLLEAAPHGRLRLHGLIRRLSEHALQADPTEARSVVRSHERYVLGLLATAAGELNGVSTPTVSARLELDRGNIDRAWTTALEAGMLDLLLDASAGLVALADVSGRRREAGAQLLAAADLAREMDHRGAEAVLVQRALRLLKDLIEVAEAKRLLDRGLAIAADDPSLRGVAAQLWLAWGELSEDRLDDLETTEAALENARSHGEAVSSPIFHAFLDANLGMAASRRARFDVAQRLLQRAIDELHAAGHVRGEAAAYASLAPVYAEQYDVWPALVADRRALETFRQLGDVGRTAEVELRIGGSYILLGAFEEAASHTLAAMRQMTDLGDLAGAAYALVQHGETLDGLGRADEATEHYEQGIGQLRELGQAHLLRVKQVAWARHLLARGHHLHAELVAREIVETSLAAGSPHFEATGCAILARTLLAQGDVLAATTIAGQVWGRYGDDARGLPWPLETLFDVHVVLDATRDPRASRTLDSAVEMMRHTARSIPEPRLRSSYLERVKVCNDLVAALSRPI